MTQPSTQPDGSNRNRQEAEKRSELREPSWIDRRDPNRTLPFADQFQISDLQLWIDLSA